MNYEELIERALSEGVSAEQIAADFSKALTKKEQEAREADRSRKEKEKYISLNRTVIEEWACGEKSPSPDVVAALAVLCAVEQKPNWPTDRLKEFNKVVEEQINGLISLYDFFDSKEGEDFFNNLKGLFFSKSKKVEGEGEEKGKGTCGPDRTCSCRSGQSDLEVIEKWLKKMGL